jgi:subtilase family serine protease
LTAVHDIVGQIATNTTSFQDEDPYPTVWSISYGLPESDALANLPLVQQTNQYLQMMQQAGSTLFASSGDFGAAQSNDGNIIDVEFPANLPYAVGVGATALYRKVGEQQNREIACSAFDTNVITSGGGYSTYFSVPSYQAPYTTSQYRGVPDVSAVGANIWAVVNQQSVNMFGTSASAPLFAAIQTLLNNRLVAAGQETLRNANSFYYTQNQAMSSRNGNGLHDITTGNNCAGRTIHVNGEPLNFPSLSEINTQCYSASVGWDPVTGCGSPNFGALLFALTGESIAPQTSSPASNSGGDSFNPDAALNFIEKHWEYFAIGGGVFLFFVIALCYGLKMRSDSQKDRYSPLDDADERESLQQRTSVVVVGPQGKSPRQQQQQQRVAYGTNSEEY